MPCRVLDISPRPSASGTGSSTDPCNLARPVPSFCRVRHRVLRRVLHILHRDLHPAGLRSAPSPALHPSPLLRPLLRPPVPAELRPKLLFAPTTSVSSVPRLEPFRGYPLVDWLDTECSEYQKPKWKQMKLSYPKEQDVVLIVLLGQGGRVVPCADPTLEAMTVPKHFRFWYCAFAE